MWDSVLKCFSSYPFVFLLVTDGKTGVNFSARFVTLRTFFCNCVVLLFGISWSLFLNSCVILRFWCIIVIDVQTGHCAPTHAHVLFLIAASNKRMPLICAKWVNQMKWMKYPASEAWVLEFSPVTQACLTYSGVRLVLGLSSHQSAACWV